jgi:predicted RNA binding protein YcfA (HicA-like mRNA interferase family)
LAKPETDRSKVVARLESEGWKNEGGGNHDKFIKPGAASPALVPRDRTLSPGVARSIAKAAGWT